MPTHSVYLSNPPNTMFQFEEIDNRTVLQFINNMKPSHCCGHDNISSNTLQLIANEVSPSLTLIINQSLSTGIFPDSLKTGKVMPIHKQDAREAMRVVFSVLTKRICMHKTNFLRTYSNIVLKVILNCMNMQIATQLIMMYNL